MGVLDPGSCSSAKCERCSQLHLPFFPHPLETKVTQVNCKPFRGSSGNLIVQSLGAEHGEKLSDRSAYGWSDGVWAELT